jgi:hypothetical protein
MKYILQPKFCFHILYSVTYPLRFDVLMGEGRKIAAFWVVTPKGFRGQRKLGKVGPDEPLYK